MKHKYAVVIEYSAEDKGYVARVPALKYCTAFGETMEEAAREIEFAIEGVLAAAKEAGKPIPAAGPSIAELQSVANVIKLSEVARLANIKEQTLFTKLRRQSPLEPKEAEAVAKALSAAGIQLLYAAIFSEPKRVKEHISVTHHEIAPAAQTKKKSGYQLYKDAQNNWGWRLVAINGQIIASGESYTSRAACERAINFVMDTNRATPFVTA